MRREGPLDSDVVRFLRALPTGLTYPGVVGVLHAVFGAEHGWSEDRVRRFFAEEGPSFWRARRGSVQRDPDIHQFVDERAGLMTGDALLDALRQNFPERLLPSRSALYRYLAHRRAELLRHPPAPGT